VLAQAQQVGASKKPPGVGEVLVVVLLEKVGTVGGVSNVTVRGVPDDVFGFRNTAKIIEGRAASPGTDEVVVGAGIRGGFKGLELGQTFEIEKNRPVKVVGVFSDDGSSRARASSPRSCSSRSCSPSSASPSARSHRSPSSS
jgi:hypothetical protein